MVHSGTSLFTTFLDGQLSFGHHDFHFSNRTGFRKWGLGKGLHSSEVGVNYAIWKYRRAGHRILNQSLFQTTYREILQA